MDKLVKSALSKGAVLSVRIGVGVPKFIVRVPERPNGAVCKTVVRRFESDSSLQNSVAKIQQKKLKKLLTKSADCRTIET